MKICFLGSGQVAVDTLSYLFEQGVEILQVITKKDKKQGRGMKEITSSLKILAKKLNLPIYQLEDWQDTSFLLKTSFSFFVVVNFGKILPQKILDIPKKCCLNIHFSLLPRFRGANPVRDCLLFGDEFSGVSIMKMVLELDAGSILAKKSIKITPQMNYQTLTSDLIKLGCQEIYKVLKNYDSIIPIAQNPKQVTYSYKIKKKDGLIDWKNSAENIYRLYQAFSPQPGVFSFYCGKKIFLRKIFILSTSNKTQQTGVIVNKNQQGIEVSTGQGSLLLELVQMENKKQLLAKDWYNGYRVNLGSQFKS